MLCCAVRGAQRGERRLGRAHVTQQMPVALAPRERGRLRAAVPVVHREQHLLPVTGQRVRQHPAVLVDDLRSALACGAGFLC